MNLLKLVLCILCLSFVGCAEIGLKPHKPAPKSTAEIAKSSGTYRIISIRGSTPEIEKMLSGDLMKCSSTTFSMPRGNTVSTFMREIFEEELSAAQKLSDNGKGISVIVKSIELTTTKVEDGEWDMEVDYVVGDKTTNVKNIIEFQSKLSILSACTHTASVFEDIVADNFVEFFKRTR